MGNGAGAAEEGITAEFTEDTNFMKTGADGQPMQSLNGSKAGRIKVSLLKTSPTNNLLMAMYNFQRTASQLWGQNVLVVSDTQRGDVLAGRSVAFKKPPSISYAKEAGMNEWEFDVGQLDMSLGAGI